MLAGKGFTMLSPGAFETVIEQVQEAVAHLSGCCCGSGPNRAPGTTSVSRPTIPRSLCSLKPITNKVGGTTQRPFFSRMKHWRRCFTSPADSIMPLLAVLSLVKTCSLTGSRCQSKGFSDSPNLDASLV